MAAVYLHKNIVKLKRWQIIYVNALMPRTAEHILLNFNIWMHAALKNWPEKVDIKLLQV